MKLIKKDGTVIMKAYGVEELESEKVRRICDEFVQDNIACYDGWARKDVIGYIQANEYLFTKEGEMLPIIHTVAPSGKVVAHKLKIAGEEVEVQIEDKGVKRIKQITIDVELEGESLDHIDEIKSHIIEEIEFSIENLLNVVQVGGLRFVDLTDEYDEMHKEGLN